MIINLYSSVIVYLSFQIVYLFGKPSLDRPVLVHETVLNPCFDVALFTQRWRASSRYGDEDKYRL